MAENNTEPTVEELKTQLNEALGKAKTLEEEKAKIITNRNEILAEKKDVAEKLADFEAERQKLLDDNRSKLSNADKLALEQREAIEKLQNSFDIISKDNIAKTESEKKAKIRASISKGISNKVIDGAEEDVENLIFSIASINDEGKISGTVGDKVLVGSELINGWLSTHKHYNKSTQRQGAGSSGGQGGVFQTDKATLEKQYEVARKSNNMALATSIKHQLLKLEG